MARRIPRAPADLRKQPRPIAAFDRHDVCGIECINGFARAFPEASDAVPHAAVPADLLEHARPFARVIPDSDIKHCEPEEFGARIHISVPTLSLSALRNAR